MHASTLSLTYVHVHKITNQTHNQPNKQTGRGDTQQKTQISSTDTSKINITPLCLAAATRSRGPRRGRLPHVCPAERRRGRLLGRQLGRAAGDWRHDVEVYTDGGEWSRGRLVVLRCVLFLNCGFYDFLCHLQFQYQSIQILFFITCTNNQQCNCRFYFHINMLILYNLLFCCTMMIIINNGLCTLKSLFTISCCYPPYICCAEEPKGRLINIIFCLATSSTGLWVNRNFSTQAITLHNSKMPIPIYSAAMPRSRGPRRGNLLHVCPAGRRRRGLLGRKYVRAAGDGRQHKQAHADEGAGARVRY